MSLRRLATVLISAAVLAATLAACQLAGLDWVVAVIVAVQAAGLTAALLFAYERLSMGVGRALQQQRDLHKVEVKEISRVLYHARLAAGTDPEQIARRSGDPRAAAPAAPAPAKAAPAPKPAPAVKAGPAKPATPSYPELTPPKVAPPPVPHRHTYPERVRFPLPKEERTAWIAARQGGEEYRPENTAPAHRTAPLPFASEIPVAMIADDFTYNSFKDEFRTYRLTPGNWRDVFEKAKPEFFFCESAWQGGPPAQQPWRTKIYASVRWPKENRTVLLEILDYCRRTGIPTVFWNKEDPTHFNDRINDFVRTAALFDYVFTTAEECIDDYIAYAGARHAALLPFAVQPRLFNPRGSAAARDVVTFAGTWYAMYRERSRVAEQLLDLVVASGRDLVIYNRMYDNQNPIYAYPERFQRFVRPAITHEQTADAFRASRFGITLNTVTDSRTMFARRAFELAACGSVVLSNTAQGVQRFFGDSVIYADREPERFLNLQDDEYQDLQHRALRIALDNTSAHRAETILDTIGVTHQSQFGRPSGLVFVGDESQYEKALGNYEANEGLEGLVAVVRRDAEQGLQMELMRRRDKGVVVLSEDDLVSGRYRTRSFLRTNGVVVADDDLSWGTHEDVAWLTAHASYEEGLIRRAPDAASRFQEAPLESLAGAYVPSSLVASAFATDRPTGYQV